MAAFRWVPTPLGPVCLAGTTRGICWCGFAAGMMPSTRGEAAPALRRLPPPEDLLHRLPGETFAPDADGGLAPAACQLRAYFAGRLRTFRVRCDLRGSPFQRAVWEELCRIPCGQVRTYAEVAAALGRPRAARAVGGACRANPVAVIVPCHRVVATSGGSGGYAGGIGRKLWLLAHEGTLRRPAASPAVGTGGMRLPPGGARPGQPARGRVGPCRT
jgi:methylated-DNA-[protein]-cysteine S-methyltransferase